MTATLVSTVHWKSADADWHEVCRLSRLDPGWELAGEFHGVELDGAYSLDYSVQLDDQWRPRLVRLRSSSPGMKPQACTLAATPAGVWKQKTGNASPDLMSIEGLTILDFDFSPAMRTQLVNQLQIPVDHTVDAFVIHVLVPEFDLVPEYRVITRTGENSYLCGYGYLGLAEEYTFTVDEHGLVRTDELGAIHVAE